MTRTIDLTLSSDSEPEGARQEEHIKPTFKPDPVRLTAEEWAIIQERRAREAGRTSVSRRVKQEPGIPARNPIKKESRDEPIASGHGSPRATRPRLSTTLTSSKSVPAPYDSDEELKEEFDFNPAAIPERRRMTPPAKTASADASRAPTRTPAGTPEIRQTSSAQNLEREGQRKSPGSRTRPTKRRLQRVSYEVPSSFVAHTKVLEEPAPSAQRKRRRRRVVDSEDDDDYMDNYGLSPTATPTSSRPEVLHVPLQAAVTRPRVKPEPMDSGDENLYSAPPVRSVQQNQGNSPQPTNRTAGIIREPTDGGGVEMWYPAPEPFVVPKAFNEAIMESDEPHRKPYAHELIKVWEPFYISPPVIAPVRFSRRFLSNVLGGSEQAVRLRPSKNKLKRQIQLFGKVVCKEYCCEMPDWNPNFPPKPGHHGVVYYLSPEDSDKPKEQDPEVYDYLGGSGSDNACLYPVFCRRSPNNWEYCGEYLQTTRQLILGEYENIPNSTKDCWAKYYAGVGPWGKGGVEALLNRGLIGMTRQGKPDVTPERVLEMFERSQVNMDAVTYECKGFNRELYDMLVTELGKRAADGITVKAEVDSD